MELGLATTRCDVCQVLDDNRFELLHSRDTAVANRAHPRASCMFGTQNPPGVYGGRKVTHNL